MATLFKKPKEQPWQTYTPRPCLRPSLTRPTRERKHYPSPVHIRQALCGRYRTAVMLTENMAEVTCKWCQRSLKMRGLWSPPSVEGPKEGSHE